MRILFTYIGGLGHFYPLVPLARAAAEAGHAVAVAGSGRLTTHGGSGGLMGALAHGLPSVLLPLGADQPHNARRAAELGVARVLDAATVAPDQIHQTVRAALADEVMAQCARRVADEVAALPGVDATVPLLEALTAGHRAG